MKRILFAFIILLTLVGFVYADPPQVISSGLQTADALIMTRDGDSWKCLSGVELIPGAAANATIVLYDGLTATGTELYVGGADAGGTPTGFPPSDVCIVVYGGIYADVGGADANTSSGTGSKT